NRAASVIGETHLLHAAARSVGEAVQLREALVDEGVIAVDQIQERPIGLYNVIKVGNDFLPHGFAKVAVELGKLLCVRFYLASKAVDIEPLQSKTFAQGLRFEIVQHPTHLLPIRLLLEEFAAFGEREQFVIGHGGPDEIRKFAGQRNRAERLHAGLARLRLGQEKEMRRDQ